jgi:hypothetical protein
MRPPDEEGPWPLVRTAKDGSGPVTLATGSACNAVAVSGDQVFWAGAGGILRADKATGAGSSVLCATDLTGGFVWELVAGDAGLWWVQVDGDEEGTSSLFAVAQGGGPVTTVDSHNAYQSL